MGGDAPRQLDTRALFAHRVERRIPALLVRVRLGRLDQRPQLDQPGRGIGQGFVRRYAGFVAGDARVNFACTEHAVDRTQHNLAGAEGMMKAQIAPAPFGTVELTGEIAAHLVEGVRRRALKREDRLLLVADREDGALDIVARAEARGELGSEKTDDLPLLGTGVLRLVDQHVVDAIVELVVHPGRLAVSQER
jgi:hypothetical protein